MIRAIKNKIHKLPNEPGIYQFFDPDGKLLYVGKSVFIKKRVASYFQNKRFGPKTNLLVSKITDIKYIKVFSEFEALLLEAELIRQNQPFFNSAQKDDKSPIYIKITGEIPLVSLVRKEKPKRGVFLKGPFPSTKTARDILKMTRKIFPYCHHKNPKKPCLFVHLGLCPYPYATSQAGAAYLKNIQRIKKLLSGKSKVLIRELTSEMKTLAKLQKYEEASSVKAQIQKLQYITSTYHTPREFLEQPTLVDDLTLKRLQDLKKVLGFPKIPKRIECYDISNISGMLATGSMVVFWRGKPDKREYRRFKIKFTKRPDDYEMIREVISRRIKNDWPAPDLMIVDGGRGQLNAALSVVNKYKYQTRVVSLAKKLEEIYTAEKIMPISLPKKSPARQLAQQIRDEAHRFAITYHRLLRSKNLIAN